MIERDRVPPPMRHPIGFALLVGAAVGLSFFLALGRAPLFDKDEGAFSEATLEMFQRGDFVSTYLNGSPRYDKPILVYWLQAASVSVFGVREFAFRFPSAVCAAIWVCLTGLFVRREFGEEAGLTAAGILATSTGVFAIGRAATADALLNMLLAATMLAAWIHMDTGRRGWRLGAMAAAALGVLAKGPIAILIPLAVTLVHALRHKRLAEWTRAMLDPVGLLIFAAIALPWYGVMIYRDGWAFVDGFFMAHNVNRFMGPLEGHAGSLIYYVPIAAAVTLPFTALALGPLRRIASVWHDPLQGYLILWFGFVFAFFSLSGTKLPHYILYGITGLVILMAVHIRDGLSRVAALAPSMLLFAGLLALPRLLVMAAPRVSDAYTRSLLAASAGDVPAGYFAGAAVGLATIVALIWTRVLPIRHALVTSGMLTVVFFSVFVVPLAARALQAPVKEAATIARNAHLDVTTWRITAPSFSVYYGRPTASRPPRPGDVVLTRTLALAELGDRHVEIIYESHGIALARIGQ